MYPDTVLDPSSRICKLEAELSVVGNVIPVSVSSSFPNPFEYALSPSSSLWCVPWLPASAWPTLFLRFRHMLDIAWGIDGGKVMGLPEINKSTSITLMR
jgi:hypothetical protein